MERRAFMSLTGVGVLAATTNQAQARKCPPPGEGMWFEIYNDEKDEWRWRLHAGNGDTIATPGEGYVNRQECLAAIDRVKSCWNAEIKG